MPLKTISALFILFRGRKKRVGNTESSEKRVLRVMKSLKCKERRATFSRDYVKQHPKAEGADSTHIAFDGGKIGHTGPQTHKQGFQQHEQEAQAPTLRGEAGGAGRAGTSRGSRRARQRPNAAN